eukprot:TRINITY_DN2085_c0_g1_i1.p1 TRINITY_DN2085_c0_g1~~TRINITY_DN2085_c0_g1_i1.p1  ORF type:complete len:388 (-),score=137.15 TRINITY_DN2085_c0_g1_i1:56-1219(-)
MCSTAKAVALLGLHFARELGAARIGEAAADEAEPAERQRTSLLEVVADADNDQNSWIQFSEVEARADARPNDKSVAKRPTLVADESRDMPDDLQPSDSDLPEQRIASDTSELPPESSKNSSPAWSSAVKAGVASTMEEGQDQQAFRSFDAAVPMELRFPSRSALPEKGPQPAAVFSEEGAAAKASDTQAPSHAAGGVDARRQESLSQKTHSARHASLVQSDADAEDVVTKSDIEEVGARLDALEREVRGKVAGLTDRSTMDEATLAKPEVQSSGSQDGDLEADKREEHKEAEDGGGSSKSKADKREEHKEAEDGGGSSKSKADKREEHKEAEDGGGSSKSKTEDGSPKAEKSSSPKSGGHAKQPVAGSGLSDDEEGFLDFSKLEASA